MTRTIIIVSYLRWGTKGEGEGREGHRLFSARTGIREKSVLMVFTMSIAVELAILLLLGTDCAISTL